MYSLHNHCDSSNSRLIDSINKIEDLLQYGFDLGLEGVAITDHETLNAHIRALNFIKKKREKRDNETKEEVAIREKWNNFKLILGNEIYLCRNGLNAENYDKTKDSFYHFILLAVDEIGHKQLRQLSTRAYSHSFIKNRMRRVPTYYSDLEEIIQSNSGHVIASSACLGSFLDKKILETIKLKTDDYSLIKDWIKYIQSIFGDGNFFLELQPALSKEQIAVNKVLIQLAHELNVSAIITTDSHFLKKDDQEIHKAFLLSKDGDREDIDSFYAYAYMMSEQEIHDYMDEYNSYETVQQLLDNTKLIGDRVTNYELSKPFKLPYIPSNQDKILAQNKTFNLPLEKLNKLEIWQNFINSNEDADIVFLHRIINKCNSNCEYFWTPERISRMEVELETVWNATKKQNIVWSKYFLQVADYIKIAWEEGDTLVGPGRGSGVGFYLNYLLDITQIDPLLEKIPTFYWRFLNPERASILDIDTDVQSNRRNKVIEALQKHYGELNVIRVGTERTEAAKAAILTSARGLGIDVEIAQSIAALIESDRGHQRSLKTTYYGDVENDIPPNKLFKEQMDHYPQLWKVAQKIEGLRSGCSCHAGGVIIVDEDITETNSLIKLNSGEWVTVWNLDESEEVSNVKIDMLATLNLTRMRTCLDLLMQYGYIQKQSTLREAYESAIGIYNLDRTNPVMWDKLANNEILSVFQFDTPQGIQSVSLARPNSIEEMASLNSIMRLMASEKGAEQPLEKYARFKKNPSLWDAEMDQFGLTFAQKTLLHNYLDYEYGICASQEDIMSMIQDPQLGGWSLKDADMLRKSVAKKDPRLYEKLTQQYYSTVEEKHLDFALCNYFWKVLVNTQRGYSFNLSHVLSYSLIGLQNMNLACNYPIIFWNTANLIVDSAGMNDEELVEDIDQDNYIDNIEEVVASEEQIVSIYEPEDSDSYEYEDLPNRKEKVKRTKKTIDYGRTAAAIGKFQNAGISVELPDINNSNFSFTPNVEKNSIMYGLRGITRISSELITEIINNRPYKSLNDLLNKVKLNKLQTINLIKSGALDRIEGKPRTQIMYDYLESVTDTKSRLTLQNMQMLIDKKLIPDSHELYKKIFLFNKFLKTCKDGEYYTLNDSAITFILTYFDDDLLINGNQILQKKWDNVYKKAMEPMRIYLKDDTSTKLKALNNILVNEMVDKYGKGDNLKYEMDSVGFYSSGHELNKIDFTFTNFYSLPEEPIPSSIFTTKDGTEIKMYDLHLIAGTVLDKNKMKNTVTLLTQYGVVTVKIYKNQFVQYDKRIAAVNNEGKKVYLETSWFSKGTLLLVQGIRRGDSFILKKYKSSYYPVISKITDIKDGTMILQKERVEINT